MDAEVNKVDEVAAAPPAAAQEKKSSESAVSDTVETAGMYLIFCSACNLNKSF